MHHFHYSGSALHCESVDLAAVAGLYGSPTYVYSAATMEDNFRRLQRGLTGLDARLCYAMKANSSLAVLRHFSNLGAGFDLVSGGEIRRVLAAGPPGFVVGISTHDEAQARATHRQQHKHALSGRTGIDREIAATGFEDAEQRGQHALGAIYLERDRLVRAQRSQAGHELASDGIREAVELRVRMSHTAIKHRRRLRIAQHLFAK